MSDITVKETTNTRAAILRAVFGDDIEPVLKAMESNGGDFDLALKGLKETFSDDVYDRINFVYYLAEILDDNAAAVQAIASDSSIKNLKEFAAGFGKGHLTSLVTPTPAGTPDSSTSNDTPDPLVLSSAAFSKLFATEPTAVLERMVRTKKLAVPDASVREGVSTFLTNQPDFNIRKESIFAAADSLDALKNIPEEQQPAVLDFLRKLQRTQALAPSAEAVPVLMNSGFTSAAMVASTPKERFVSMMAPEISMETAASIHEHAVNTQIRNEQAMTTLLQTVRGTGLAVIDGRESVKERLDIANMIGGKSFKTANLERLFGDLDIDACDDCNSVTSPAAYFVEILQFLRNNNLDNSGKFPNTGQKGIEGTVLEKLFARRPDLGNLELTCTNTNTVLPYLDLANEVMESFVVHLDKYTQDTHTPKRADIDVYNNSSATSGELLSEPQNTNYGAYCILSSKVYPFNKLPYHQSLDEVRIFLKYLGTSRYELLDTYRSAPQLPMTVGPGDGVGPTATEIEKLKELHVVVQNRAVTAEYLNLTQEEYIALTREAYWPKQYFEIVGQASLSNEQYQTNVGLKGPWEYWGYKSEAELLSSDERTHAGLQFIKSQFLSRAGIQFSELIDVLKTEFVNPYFPRGKALAILESIRFNFKFLNGMVTTDAETPAGRYKAVIDFLEKTQPWISLVEINQGKTASIYRTDTTTTLSRSQIRNWVYKYFGKISKLIVVESGQGPELPFEGILQKSYIASERSPELVGFLKKNGRVYKPWVEEEVVIARIASNGQLFNAEDPMQVLVAQRPLQYQVIVEDRMVAYFDDNGFLTWVGESNPPRLVYWSPPSKSWHLDNARLVHLDGTTLDSGEWMRIQQFIRLWRKMGWTIDETDKAISGLSPAKVKVRTEVVKTTPVVGFGDFKPSATCECEESEYDPSIDSEEAGTLLEITPGLLDQLVSVVKLLPITGLELLKLLTFWSTISTQGDHSLYSRLFLTHNLIGVDPIFKPDDDGNYLTQSAKIGDHMAVVLAALNITKDGLDAIKKAKFKKVNGVIDDDLSLSNLSILYRHNLMAKILHVTPSDLFKVIKVFGDPFESAARSLEILEVWGRMEDAGFSFQQLNYVLQGADNPLKPIGPSKIKILTTMKTLFDGLQAIDTTHPMVVDTNKDVATKDILTAKLSLLFDNSLIQQILEFLEGMSIWTTNAPRNLEITIPTDTKLSSKLKYLDDKTAKRATIQVTGILTTEETTVALALSEDAGWGLALKRVGKKPLNWFNDTFGFFENLEEAKAILLAGDVFTAPPPPILEDGSPSPVIPAFEASPITKRFYFLQNFVPFLRGQLSDRLIIDTMSGMVSLNDETTRKLLSEILLVQVGTKNEPAIKILQDIRFQEDDNAKDDFIGYLVPASNDAYTFIATSTERPPALQVNGIPVPFKYQQDDPSDVWSTDPVSLTSGRLYPFRVINVPTTNLAWKTARSPSSTIPESALLPQYAEEKVNYIFTKLTRAAIIINGFNLSVDEITYLSSNAADFPGFEKGILSFDGWKRLLSYFELRNSLPKLVDQSLLGFFKWAANPEDKTLSLAKRIADLTLVKEETVEKLLTGPHFDWNDPKYFRNETALTKLKKACDLAVKVTVDVDSLFNWAQPLAKFWPTRKIAEEIRRSIRARFTAEEWESIVKPLRDQLRRNQREALIGYLLVQPELIRWGVVDADSLFEFFLIDVQMGSCLETSRIKQAISTVQLFVQRCLIGLEEDYGVPNDALDRKRWDWMQKYPVWEANRRVFLYPENWIDPSLRDDKSQIFQDFEADLLQKDLNPQNIQDSVKNYLFKVDEVANLQVVAMYVDGGAQIMHIFARTRGAPFFYYYRVYNITEDSWRPWEKMQIDIPNYEAKGAVNNGGTFLVPVVWKGRLIVFIPQFLKQTEMNNTNSGTIEHIGTTNTSTDILPKEYWEVKLGWTEYRNGKWTPKQLTSEFVRQEARLNANPVNGHRFFPSYPDGNIDSDVFYIYVSFGGDTPFGRFEFSGGQLRLNDDPVDHRRGQFWGEDFATSSTKFLEFNAELFDDRGISVHSVQDSALQHSPGWFWSSVLYQANNPTTPTIQYKGGQYETKFYHQFSNQLLSKTTASSSLDDLYAYLNSVPEEYKNNAFGFSTISVGPDGKQYPSYHELRSPYSLYNWEIGLHAPMLLVDKLTSAQQYDKAREIAHFVFDPMGDGEDLRRVWKWAPFKEISTLNVLETIFDDLKPNTPDTSGGQINGWRNNPFQPHVVARSRPVAYMKWMVMKYINILIASGDQLFRQNTLESVPLAIQYYTLAAHLYGPPGQQIPKRGKKDPETFNSLVDKLDAFDNAVVDFEIAFPFSNQIGTSVVVDKTDNNVILSNVLGTATSRYFCVPDNAQLRALRATIDDRLYKIRHCQDINGNTRKLALFEPPIDPAALVQAAAQGLSLSNVLQDLNAPMPNYRFQYLLQKAFDMVQELKSLGGAFLNAKEKRDSEAYQLIRAGHETTINTMVLEMKKLNLEEATKTLDSLRQSRKGPVYRLQHFYKLIGEDLGKIPAEDSEYQELIEQIEAPLTDGGLKLISYEKQEIDKASTAAELGIARGALDTLSGIFHALPSTTAQTMPFGLGGSIDFGPQNIAKVTSTSSRVLGIAADYIGSQSTGAARKGAFLRQLQDRVQQANSAGYELKNIDAQIQVQQTRISIASRDIELQQKQIDSSIEIEQFLRTKYTNANLYSWQENQLRGLYYQTYTLAHDLAKKAEKTYQFERGLADSNFIQGYWDANNDGLLSGEGLTLGLKRLEAAYQENRGYDYELTKHISLRQLDPRALLELRELGTCEFVLPEVIFDMDFPGHYKRRIKSVSLSIPCIVGPYTSINCTMRLLSHKYRISVAKDKNDYIQKINEADPNFQTNVIPLDHIAISNGQTDSGVFELNFKDERYIPFEGAGVVSQWQLELPSGFRQFDYRTITDAIVHVRYTSVSGGDKLKQIAADSVKSYIKNIEDLSKDQGLGILALFDLKNEFASEWYRFGADHPLTMPKLNERLPFFTKGRQPNKIIATQIQLLVSGTVSHTALHLTVPSGNTTEEINFTEGVPIGNLKCFSSTTDNMFGTWSLRLDGPDAVIDDMWMLVRYTLS